MAFKQVKTWILNPRGAPWKFWKKTLRHTKNLFCGCGLEAEPPKRYNEHPGSFCTGVPRADYLTNSRTGTNKDWATLLHKRLNTVIQAWLFIFFLETVLKTVIAKVTRPLILVTFLVEVAIYVVHR